MSSMLFFATCPRGVEPLLAEELRRLGGERVKEGRAGVTFGGDLETAYRACLWSRLASRVLLNLLEFPAAGTDELYDGVRRIQWHDHLDPAGTFAVDANVFESAITHSNFAAVRVKDAIVDQMRERTGSRPSIDTARPDLRLNLRLHRNVATLSIDVSGESLHRRGYREEGVAAPLKENLAAAILLYAKWPDIAAGGGPLLDPMCGSGTFLIEAALMAADSAPGLLRDYFGFIGWRGHDAGLWEKITGDARQRRETGLARLPKIYGFDVDAAAVAAATVNVDRAGLRGRIVVERRDAARLADFRLSGRPGLVVTNPPYGERLGTVRELMPLYAAVGDALREHFVGWKAAVFTGNPDLARELGLKARRTRTLFNGALECRLFHYDVEPGLFFREKAALPAEPVELSPGATMLANRLGKNLKTVGAWARSAGVACYRLYDADMPEYAVAVDIYANGTGEEAQRWVHVQEYEAPKTVDETKARQRLREAMTAVEAALDVPADGIFLKVRRRGKGGSRYGKMAEQGVYHEVREFNCRFLVNFSDYLDTGLFLDHRDTRMMIQKLSAGRSFLNLFAYTGTGTVHAAQGGATSTVTVDMSRTYLDWAKRNMTLNGFEGRMHEFIPSDCFAWLERERSRRFDLIFLDPPTFSNSKRMGEDTLDIQRDHVRLITAAAKLLSPDGILIFSNNNRRFKMDMAALADLRIEEITKQTIPRDFHRNPRIHNCWKISRQ